VPLSWGLIAAPFTPEQPVLGLQEVTTIGYGAQSALGRGTRLRPGTESPGGWSAQPLRVGIAQVRPLPLKVKRADSRPSDARILALTCGFVSRRITVDLIFAQQMGAATGR
jgi:hypothetical protein